MKKIKILIATIFQNGGDATKKHLEALVWQLGFQSGNGKAVTFKKVYKK